MNKDKYIAEKIKKLLSEGKGKNQAIATSYNEWKMQQGGEISEMQKQYSKPMYPIVNKEFSYPILKVDKYTQDGVEGFRQYYTDPNLPDADYSFVKKEDFNRKMATTRQNEKDYEPYLQSYLKKTNGRINQLVSYQDGGRVYSNTPKEFGRNIQFPNDTRQFTQAELEEATRVKDWSNNWVENRVINGQKVHGEANPYMNFELPQEMVVEDMNSQGENGYTLGSYNTAKNRLTLDNRYNRVPGTLPHELGHKFQSNYLDNNPTEYLNYLSDPIEEINFNKKGLTPYQKNPRETHSEINAFRYENNLKPDQVITTEDIEKYDFKDYNLNQYSKEELLYLFNNVVNNDKYKEINRFSTQSQTQRNA